MRIPESELVLNEQGRVYHLNLHPEMIAQKVIVVGDPDRIPKVSQYFDKIHFKESSREIVTHTGELSGEMITAISSGMGTDNVELLITELDILVNVDLSKREIKSDHTSLEIYRIGTSGCLQADIPIDTLLASKAALGLDTLMSFYQWNDKECAEFINDVKSNLELNFQPYFAKASSDLLTKFGSDFEQGVTITAPGFYAPQGRQIRLPLAIDGMLDRLRDIQTPSGRFTNFEMETAAYYALCELLGHKMISLNALIANRALKQFSTDHHHTVKRLIEKTLEIIVAK